VLRAADPVVLPHLGSVGRLWSAVLDVADQRANGWTLIGVLMVMLYEHEAGMLEFDVIAPEGMGGRADLTTVPPLRAPQLAGTRQALDRTQRIAVDLGGRAAALPRPDLLGALVVKACAAAGDHVRGPQRHLEDLARLYRLVTDPGALTPTTKDPKRLRDPPDPPGRCWRIRPAGLLLERLIACSPPRPDEARRRLPNEFRTQCARTCPPSTPSVRLHSLSSRVFAELQ
jgi:hypothetical protein